jgi:uncharacterized membrane protein YkvI
MSLTSLLTLIAMFDVVRSEVPKVSYVSFMDVWMTACVIVIFLTVAEFAIVHSLCRRKMKRKAIRVDDLSRYLFMLVFMIFNGLYWPLLLYKCRICEIINENSTNSTAKLKII